MSMPDPPEIEQKPVETVEMIKKPELTFSEDEMESVKPPKSSGEDKTREARRKGTRQLRIDLKVPSKKNSGLKIR